MNEVEKFQDDMAVRLFGRSREIAREGGQCVKCGEFNLEFRDELSRKEHGISGFCQSCQDDIFGPADEDKEETLDQAHDILGLN